MEKVYRFIEAYQLLRRGDHVLLGVSGGADSVCLFLIMDRLRKQYHLTLKVIHINHGLRKEAIEEQHFVENLARTHGISCVSVKKDVQEIAKQRGISLEEAGRQVRREVFQQEMKDGQFTKTALAHHKNDQAETLLFRLARGTGIAGLAGMRPESAFYIRPLLCLDKHEIRSWLIQQNQQWMEDASNEDNRFARNKIRHKVIPELEEINDKTVEHMVSFSQDAAQIHRYLQRMAAEAFDRCVKMRKGSLVIEKTAFLKEDPVIQKLILKMSMEAVCGHGKDLAKCHVKDLNRLMKNHHGKTLFLPYNMKAIRTYQGIRMRKDFHGELKPTGMGRLELNETDCFEKRNGKEYTQIIDYDKIKTKIVLRTARQGDYFVFDSKERRKKLSRFFIDQKIERDRRDHIPLAADGDHIIWIVGQRLSESYKVTDQTKHYLKLTYIPEESEEYSDEDQEINI